MYIYIRLQKQKTFFVDNHSDQRKSLLGDSSLSTTNNSLLITESERVDLIRIIKSLLTASYEKACKEINPQLHCVDNQHVLYKVAKEIHFCIADECTASDLFLDAMNALYECNNTKLQFCYNSLSRMGLISKIQPSTPQQSKL